MTDKEKETIENYIKIIGSNFPIIHHRIFNRRRELKLLSGRAESLRRKYSNRPELAQQLVDQLVLDAKNFLQKRRTDEENKREEKYSAGYSDEELISLIGTKMVIPYRNIFSRNMELQILAGMAINTRKEYKNKPDLGQVIIESFILSSESIFLETRRNDPTIRRYALENVRTK